MVENTSGQKWSLFFGKIAHKTPNMQFSIKGVASYCYMFNLEFFFKKNKENALRLDQERPNLRFDRKIGIFQEMVIFMCF